MGKEIIVEDKRNDSYKLILKVELDEDDELLLKKIQSTCIKHKIK